MHPAMVVELTGLGNGRRGGERLQLLQTTCRRSQHDEAASAGYAEFWVSSLPSLAGPPFASRATRRLCKPQHELFDILVNYEPSPQKVIC